MLGVTIRSVCFFASIPITFYLIIRLLNNEYTCNNRVIIFQKEYISNNLYHEIKNLFYYNIGYTASFWSKKIASLPSIISAEIIRKPKKTWVVSINQTQPKALINEKFVFCDQGLIDRAYFTDEQLTDCPRIITTNDYTYEQLDRFLPSVIAIGTTYTKQPLIEINSPYNCYLRHNGITIQFGKNSFPVDQEVIKKILDQETQKNKNKTHLIADIRFKNQIILHRPKAASS